MNFHLFFRRAACSPVPVRLRHGIAVAAALLAAVGVQQAIRVPPPKDVEIAIAGLPPQFDGYRVLQLSDLHVSRLFERPWTEAVVRGANALEVDLVVVTGDLIDGVVADRLHDLAPLRGLRAPDGVYVIPGNHESFFDYPAYMRHVGVLGMVPLANAHVVAARDVKGIRERVIPTATPARRRQAPRIPADPARCTGLDRCPRGPPSRGTRGHVPQGVWSPCGAVVQRGARAVASRQPGAFGLRSTDFTAVLIFACAVIAVAAGEPFHAS